MSYTYLDITSPDTGEVVRHIFEEMDDGGVRSFPYVDDHPLKSFVDDWVAEGNVLEELE